MAPASIVGCVHSVWLIYQSIKKKNHWGFFIFFNWDIVALQCSVSFWCKNWIIYICTYILSLDLPPPFYPSRGHHRALSWVPCAIPLAFSFFFFPLILRLYLLTLMEVLIRKARDRIRRRKIRNVIFLEYTFKILIGVLYNIVMDFAIHQHELAIGIHVSPPPWTPFPPPSPPYPSRLSQNTSFGHPES